MLRFLTAGESHGPALVVTVEGMPAGLPILVDDIAAELARRRLGYGRGPRMRFEADELELLGGIRHGRTLGSPIAIVIRNSEWATAWVNSFDRLTQEPIEFIDAGNDQVLIEFIQRGWMAGSDVPVELRTWSVSTVKGGKFVRTLLFQSRNDALEAAGLSE